MARKVRVRLFETFAEVYARLTRRQQHAVTQVTRAHTAVEEQRSLLDLKTVVLHRSVQVALDEGVPARMLAQIMGVTTSRIYKIKEQMEAVDRAESA